MKYASLFGGAAAITELPTDGGIYAQESDYVVPVGFIYDETIGTALAENDIAAGRIDAKRALIGVLEDGATRGVRASVFDYSNSNPLAVRLTDENGDYVSPSGSLPAGASTEAKQDDIITALGSLATAANQTTLLGYVDGIETLLGGTLAVSAAALPLPTGAATETTLDAIKTSVQLLDNAISGDKLQVDILTLPNVTIGAAIPAGSNNIGDVDVASQPARAATTDTITAKLATDAIMDGTTALTPKFAVIDAATSGDNTLVAAVASKKIRVLALYLVSAGSVNVRFESGAGGTALSGQMNLVANTGFVLPFNPVGWFETASNTLLNLELSAAISCDGTLVYVEV